LALAGTTHGGRRDESYRKHLARQQRPKAAR
jgi:hypothetical protein